MLVLSRKVNERLILADGLIVITVTDVRGDKVRIGIDAPDDISIFREEIFEQRKLHASSEENRSQETSPNPTTEKEGDSKHNPE